MPTKQSSAAVFSSKGIECIGVIDDAFDPLRASALPSVAVSEFLAEIEQNEVLQRALKQHGIVISKLSDMTDAVLEVMHSKQDEVPGLRSELDKLLATRAAIVADADEIVNNIRSLQFTVHSSGTSGPLVHEAQCKIIFLDYFLGSSTGPEAERAVEAAVTRATEIYGRQKGQSEKTIFVLMSSSELSDQQVIQFRKRSRLLGGMFHHAPKSLLKNRNALERKLLAIALSMPVAGGVVSLIEALERSLDAARETFIDRLMDLSLEDYAYIDRLSLKEDGQPFGEYLLWLFGAELYKSVFENVDVRAHRDAVDRVRFPGLPARQISPSLQLASMYGAALIQKLSGELQVHPLGDAANEFPLLSLGDIFVGPEHALFMVINPECDLAFSPMSKGRPFSKTKSIVLVPGSLEELSKASTSDDGKIRTELFVHEEREYRIIWDIKRIVVKEYGSIKQWAEEAGYKRLYRLRLLYALQVQQRFTADFGRVGPPVAPPLFTPVRLEVFGFDKDGKSQVLLGPLDGCAALVTGKDGLSCVFDLGFLEELIGITGGVQDGISERVHALEEQLAATRNSVPSTEGTEAQSVGVSGKASAAAVTEEWLQKMEAKIERLRTLEKNLAAFETDTLMQMNFIAREYPMPSLGDLSVIDSETELFSICYEKSLKGNYHLQSLLTLSVTRAI